MNLSVPHRQDRATALSRIKTMLEALRREHADKISGVSERWSGDRGEFAFTTFGFNVSGALVVTDREVRLEGKIPFAALPFKGRIVTIVQKKAVELLA